MIVRYTPCPVRSAVPALGGSLILPRPILAVHDTDPSGARRLDTGADGTRLDSSVTPCFGPSQGVMIGRITWPEKVAFGVSNTS